MRSGARLSTACPLSPCHTLFCCSLAWLGVCGVWLNFFFYVAWYVRMREKHRTNLFTMVLLVHVAGDLSPMQCCDHHGKHSSVFGVQFEMTSIVWYLFKCTNEGMLEYLKCYLIQRCRSSNVCFEAKGTCHCHLVRVLAGPKEWLCKHFNGWIWIDCVCVCVIRNFGYWVYERGKDLCWFSCGILFFVGVSFPRFV